MFTGLVQAMAEVAEVRDLPPGKQLSLRLPSVANPLLGESIAVNGCCLSVTQIEGSVLSFDAGPETLARTNLGQLRGGSRVNIERSLSLGDKMGGHLVTGHVDGLGRLDARNLDGAWATLWFCVPAGLTRQMASKGSVTVDGVSLTLVDVEHERFSVALIPHTLAETTLGRLNLGDAVNIETDLLAKYVERQLAALRS